MSEDSVNDNYELKKKVQKEYPTFTDAVDSLQVPDLDKNLILYSKHREETMEAQRKDVRMKEVKEEIAVASKPYDDKIKEFKGTLNKLKKFIDKEISRNELEKTMLEYTKLLDREEKAKANDSELKSLKQLSKELNEPYAEALKALKMKISYLNALVEEKSEGLSGEVKEA